MAKKATTGVPTRRKGAPAQDSARTYLSRAEREARAQRWVLIGIGVALGLALIVLLVGIIMEGFVRPNQPIAVVNGVAVTTVDFEKRVRLERWQSGQLLVNVANLYGVEMLTSENSPFYQQVVQLLPGQEAMLGSQVRDQMVDEILIRQEAAARGITADAAEIDARIEEFFGYNPNPEEPTPTLAPSATPTPIVSPTPSPVPTATPEPEETPLPTSTPLPTVTPQPTLTAEELATRYQEISTEYLAEAARVSGMSQEEIRAVFEVQVLRAKLQEAVTADIGPIEEQVNVRQILVSTEEEAQDVLTALAEGESFAELARAISIDTASGRQGGELGWAGRGRYVPEFEDAVFNGEIGPIIGPVQSDYGYHIIQIRAREDRELTDAELEQKRQTAFTDWLAERRAAAEISYPYDYTDRTPDDPTIYDLGLAGLLAGAGS